MIIQPSAATPQPSEKRIALKTRSGEQVSLDVSLSDDRGKQSAADYVRHLYVAIKEKLGEPVIFTGSEQANPDDIAAIKKEIIFIAAFHDSMFGTFNRQTKLPEAERDEFVELFLLAAATLLPGTNLMVDLSKGSIVSDAGMN
jgi:hypothetical protein